jgi:hypothetical protein
MGASGQSTGYEIDQSIRFNSDNSAYMQKTYSGNGSRTTWSFSFWTKLGKSPPYNSTRGNFLIAYNTSSGAQEDIRIEGTNQQLQWFTHNDGGTGTLADLKTTQYLRDHSAWYHILCVADRTNAVASERQRMYINGQRVTDFATETYPSQSAEGHVGKSADVHYIGSRAGNSSTRIDGYMAEIFFLDGYAYDASYFGKFDENGIWIPIDYNTLTGDYGSNGYYLKGDNAGTLGNSDVNSNHFTLVGITNHDQTTDTPNNNFAVLNTLDSNSNVTQRNGNLEWTSSAADGGCRSTIFFNADNSDKFYIEAIVGTYASAFSFGISNPDRSLSGDAGEDLADFYGWYINPGGNWIASGSNPWNTGSNYNSGSLDVLQMAVDASDHTSIKLFAGINNTYYNSSGGTDGNPSTGANPTATITGGEEWSIGLWNRNSAASNIFVNFGQEGTFGGNKTAGGNKDKNNIGNFFHAVPSGYLALCTRNLFTG